MPYPIRTTLAMIGLTALLASCTSAGQPPGVQGVQGPPAPSPVAPSPAAGTPGQASDLRPVRATSANVPRDRGFSESNAWDDDLGTGWGTETADEWIRFDLGTEKTIEALSLAWQHGDQRVAHFDLELSTDGDRWTPARRLYSSGTTPSLERYEIGGQHARFLRVTNRGNSEDSSIGITEVRIHSVRGAAGNVSGTEERTYFVDCHTGKDSHAGTTSEQAWKSLSKVNASALKPGDRLLLKRGCSWEGPLHARWSGRSDAPIVIDVYGQGEAPLIRNGRPGAVVIAGSHQIIQNLRVTADRPPRRDTGRCNGPLGWHAGFAFTSGSRHNTLQNSQASGLTAGVHLESGSTHNRVLRNQLTNNDVMSKNNRDNGNNDSGAWGVLINGDDNEVAYNYFEGNTACSEDYGVEGASLELYYAKRNYFHHNTSINDTTFAELGGSRRDRSEHNRFEYNLYAPLDTNGRGEALVIRGHKSDWGGNPGTVFNHNTVYNSNVGVYCGDGCNRSILTLKNNIIVTRAGATKDTLWTDGPIDESGNVFWQLDGERRVFIEGQQLTASSTWGDPKLTDPRQRKFEPSPEAPNRRAGALPLP
ncbi:discoidin domain-containing protein [Deinococcus peraridilitoris]|uniref:Nitrous oxidase accessory protein n=1 Tax=Deinococcus peraridilitoris (strain DSM 19664 / LMG 22246 / CIP 109416 / KR-200) TaxID=937777 RepID=K9ZZ71_DEIPD|nr:discoidin domain-containing protein [Deinococcus peraridilitoris]AFZ66943.1 nitrous oxidase accessory protein [Deinococcus peraridilitoris DSM 19664]